MSARTKARKRALDLLYSADVRGEALTAVLEDERRRAAAEPDRRASFVYADQIVSGYLAHQASIDELIASFAKGWTLDRMPRVDLAVLRVGVWELLYNDEIPTGVAISEATQLAADLSTEGSPRFVTGVLANIAQQA